MTERETLAYLAGYIDGDGSICAVKHHNSFGISLVSISGDKSVLELLAETFGGKCLPTNQKSPNRKLYHWAVTGKEAVNALERLIPFLTAKLLPAIHATRFVFNPSGGIYRVPEWQVKVREDAARKIRAFNHRVTN